MNNPILLSMALRKLIPDLNFSYNSGDTYESIIFPEGKTVPPKQDLENALNEAKEELDMINLRELRNKKLLNSDYYMGPDFKFNSKEDRELIVKYRQELRDFPKNNKPIFNEYNELSDINFPVKPNISLHSNLSEPYDFESYINNLNLRLETYESTIENLVKRITDLEIQ